MQSPWEGSSKRGCVPGMQQCCLVTVTALIRGCCEPARGHSSCTKEQRRRNDALKYLQNEKKFLKQKTSSCRQKKLRAGCLSSRLCCALSLHSNACARAATALHSAETHPSFWMLQCFLPSSLNRCPSLLKCSFLVFHLKRISWEVFSKGWFHSPHFHSLSFPPKP